MSGGGLLRQSRRRLGINGGDLYELAGVRWVVGAADEMPAWAALHPEAWSAREERLCLTLGGARVCLYELP